MRPLRLLLFILYILYATSLSAKVEDSLFSLSNFYLENRKILTDLPTIRDSIPNKFELSTEESDIAKALIEADDSVATILLSKTSLPCQKSEGTTEVAKKIENQPLVITMAATTPPEDKYLPFYNVRSMRTQYEQIVENRFWNNQFNGYLTTLQNQGNSHAGLLNSFDSSLSPLIQFYKANNPSTNYDALPFRDKVNALNAFANSFLTVVVPSGIIAKELAYNEMIANPNNWQSVLNDSKDILTLDQKIKLVSQFGGQFNLHYNSARNANPFADNGIVTIEQLLTSLQTNTVGGICRDVALAQSKMLKTLGFNQTYIVTNQVAYGQHTNVMAIDPNTGKIIKFNYDEVTSMKANSGADALIQDTSMPEHGIVTKVYDSDGHPLTQVKTQLGQMLSEVTNEPTQIIAEQKKYSLARIGYKNESTEGNLFTGLTSSGEKIYGLAVSRKGGQQDNNIHYDYSAGGAYAYSVGDRTYIKFDQHSLLFRMHLGMDIDFEQDKDGDLESSLFLGSDLHEQLSFNNEINKETGYNEWGKSQLQLYGHMYLGLKGTLDITDNSQFKHKTILSFYPDLTNVAAAGTRTFASDGLSSELSFESRMAPGQFATMGTTILLKKYGASVGINAAYELAKAGVVFEGTISGPITKDMPTFLPGGTINKQLSVTKKGVQGVTYTLEFQRDPDTGDNRYGIKFQKDSP